MKTEKLLSYIRDGETLTYKQQLALVGKLSMPGIMAQLSSVVMQYIDAAMVGRLGSNGAASIGLVSTTIWLFGSVCVSFVAGFSVQVAQYTGANKKEDAESVLRQSALFILLISAVIGAVGACISRFLPVWLGADAALQKGASAYFLIYVCSLPAMCLSALCSSMLQASGNMKVPSFLNILMCVLDVVFNALFIFELGLGVAGAALGTAVAELVIALAMFYYLCAKNKTLRFDFHKKFCIMEGTLKRAVKIALPIAFEHFVVCGAMIVTTRIVAPLGVVALAANSFAVTAESLCYMPGYGVGEAATTLVGQSIGAGRKNLTRHFARMTVIAGMVVMSVTGILMYMEAPLMMAMLSTDTAVQELGVKILRIEAFAEPMYAAAIVVAGALRGAGDTLIPSTMNFASLWLVRIPLSFLMVGKYGLVGVWIAMALELCFRGIIFLIRLVHGKWMKDMI